MKVEFKDIDSYIATFPEDVQQILEQIRSVIKNSVPEAEEVISYNMPAFKYHGILVYFAGYKNHIGFYALPSGHKHLRKNYPFTNKEKALCNFH